LPSPSWTTGAEHGGDLRRGDQGRREKLPDAFVRFGGGPPRTVGGGRSHRFGPSLLPQRGFPRFWSVLIGISGERLAGLPSGNTLADDERRGPVAVMVQTIRRGGRGKLRLSAGERRG